MSDQRAYSDNSLATVWPQRMLRAARALRRAYQDHPEMSPRAVAFTALSVLPVRPRTRLLHQLDARGWLESGCALDADALDADRCPSEFRGPQRELLRLALFGLPGQGMPGRVKHREALFQRLSGEIMREAGDERALSTVVHRVMSHPEVMRDSILAGMLRSFAAEREIEVRARAAAHIADPKHVAPPAQVAPTSSARHVSAREQTRTQIERLLRDYDDQLIYFNLAAADGLLTRIEAMRKQYPELISAPVVSRCRMDLVRVRKRREAILDEVSTLTQTAIDAARTDDQPGAARALRRISSIHAARPELVSDDAIEQIRAKIMTAGDSFEHRESARKLVERERSVVGEIRKMAMCVHNFHQIVRHFPHNGEAFERAEAQYRQSIREIRSHETEWLADLIVELDDLIEDIHDPTGRAGDQVNRFIERVRFELNAVRRETRAIHHENTRKEPSK